MMLRIINPNHSLMMPKSAYLWYVDAKISVDARTFNAYENAEVEGSPIGFGGPTVGAYIIAADLPQQVNGLLVFWVAPVMLGASDCAFKLPGKQIPPRGALFQGWMVEVWGAAQRAALTGSMMVPAAGRASRKTLKRKGTRNVIREREPRTGLKASWGSRWG